MENKSCPKSKVAPGNIWCGGELVGKQNQNWRWVQRFDQMRQLNFAVLQNKQSWCGEQWAQAEKCKNNNVGQTDVENLVSSKSEIGCGNAKIESD